MYYAIISTCVMILFVYMDWPLSLIYATITLSGFLSVIGMAITLYRNRNSDKFKLAMATSVAQLKKSFVEFASTLNSSVSIRELNNLIVITIKGEQPSIYYVPVKSSTSHEVYGIDASTKRTKLTAVTGTDYGITPKELGYKQFVVVIQGNEYVIEEREKLTLKRIEELEDEMLNVD